MHDNLKYFLFLVEKLIDGLKKSMNLQKQTIHHTPSIQIYNTI